jgi:hypothetical protein
VKLRNKRHLNRPAAEQRRVVEGNLRGTKKSLAMAAAMRLESLGERYIRYPFGIRIVFTAVKPEGVAR